MNQVIDWIKHPIQNYKKRSGGDMNYQQMYMFEKQRADALQGELDSLVSSLRDKVDEADKTAQYYRLSKYL